MQRLSLRLAIIAAVLVAAVGAVIVVNDARRDAAEQTQVAQLITQFGTDALSEEVMAERLLRASTPERRQALAAARREARATLARARGIADTPALAGLAVLHDRYELAVDAEQAQADRDFALRSTIHDRQVVPAFSALRDQTEAQVGELARAAQASQDRADALSAAAILTALLLAGGLTARLVRQRARLARAEQHAQYEDERRRLTEASEWRVRQMVEQIADALVIVDHHGKIVDVNPAAQRVYDRQRDDLLTLTIFDLSAMDVPTFRASVEGVREHGTVRVEGTHRRRDGTEFPIEATLSRYAIDGQDMVLGAIRDISERRAMEEEARRGAAELARRVRQQASVVQLGQLALEGTQREGLFASAAAALRDTLGVEHAGVLERLPDGAFRCHGAHTSAGIIPAGGLATRGFTHPEGLRVDDLTDTGPVDPLCAPGARAALLAVVPGDREGYGLLVAQSNTVAFTDEDLSYVRAVAHVLGAAIRREVGLELERQLEQSTRLESLGMLAGGVAHDFNNLLSVIISFVQFALDGDGDGDREQHREDLGEALSAARRAAELTAQLLAFSRVGRGDPEPIDVNAAVDQTQAMLRRTLGENVVLQADLDPTIAHIELVPGQLEQILVNLAVNARDAMPGGGHLTISTRDRPAAGGSPRAVELRVTDTGSGMPDEVRAKAFDPFFSTKLPGAGTGLGLATVHGIVSRAGGHAEIESTTAGGTTVVLRFVAANGTAPEPEHQEEPRRDGEGELVMVVEDEPQVLALTSRILRMHGYRVAEADSPERAIALRADLRPAVLLTDVVMPGISGAELAERLLADDPELRVVFMTGYAGNTDLGRFGDGVAIVQKPFSAGELLGALAGDAER
jgi:PAS domain S-box-containing protein